MRNVKKKLKKKDKFISKIDKIQLKNMNNILWPINIISMIFGSRVIEFPQGHSRPIISFLYSMIINSLFNIGWFYCEKEFYKSNMFKLNESISTVIFIINHILIFLLIIMGLYQTKAMKLYAKKINEIDETLQTLNPSAHFNSIYKTTIRYIIFGLFYLLIFSTIKSFRYFYEEQETDPSLLITYLLYPYNSYNFMVKFIMVIEFLTIVRCIKSEFRRANELLSDVNVLPISSMASELIEYKEFDGSLSIERYLPNDSKRLFIPRSQLHQTQSRLQVANHRIKKSRTLLRTIRQVHLQLYKVSKNLGDIYGIQISLEMAMCILFNTYVLYSFYSKYQEVVDNTNQLIFPFFITILYCLQYSIKIFFINYVCDKTTKEAEHTKEILHTFYGQNMDLKIQKEVEIFSLQMMQCRITYSPLGLYNLNCKYIYTCIGIIATYMVILIQISNSK